MINNKHNPAKLYELSKQCHEDITTVRNHTKRYLLKNVAKILENFSEEGDVVYDPFMGTGTTAVVAKRLKRKYLGSEISKKYIDISEDRLKKSEDLFTE